MNLSQLIDQFELVTDIEDGLKKFRNLILNLAFRGKLTKQESNDEPAEKLLERIKEEKQRMYNEGKIRKPKDLTEIDEEEIPFKLPQHWTWSRLGNIYHNWGNKTPDRDFQYIDVGSIDKKNGIIGNDIEIINPGDAPSRAKQIIKEGTVLYSTVRPYLLNVAIYNGNFDYEPIASTAFEIIHPIKGIYNKYVYYYLRSPIFTEYVESTMVGVAYPAVNKGDMIEGYFPLPSLDEQQRIVQKIETLFARVDELEQKVEQESELDEHLQVAILDDLQHAKTPEASRQSWQRLTDHFEQIYRKPEHIDQLKQAILNEAVRGRLVPQNSGDEPAEKLLERIKEEKHRLYEEGEIRKPKELPEITEEEILYALPGGWVWTRLGEIGNWGAGATPTRSNSSYYGGNIPWLKTGELNDSYISESEEKVTEKGFENTSLRLCKPGDILIAMYGATIGKLGILEIEATTNQACCACTPSKGLSNIYLFYYLLAMRREFRSLGAGGAQPNISKTKIEKSLIALPPLNEQNKVVEKIRQMYSWCDELKSTLHHARQTDRRLLEALVKQATEEKHEEPKEATIYQMPQRRKLSCGVKKVSGMSTTDMQAGMLARIVHFDGKFIGAKEHVGRTKMEKTCHIIESHAKVDLGRKPKRMQFGAADYVRLRRKIEPRAQKAGWLAIEEKNGKTYYRQGIHFFEPFQKIDYRIPDRLDKIDRIINLFIPLTTREAEVRQTVYAAWHDLIAYGKDPSEDEIVLYASTEEYWAKEKEEISKEEYYKGINWLRENDLIPDGKGKITVKP